eukprot:9487599-Pyramimonas_sp.AAC.1
MPGVSWIGQADRKSRLRRCRDGSDMPVHTDSCAQEEAQNCSQLIVLSDSAHTRPMPATSAYLAHPSAYIRTHPATFTFIEFPACSIMARRFWPDTSARFVKLQKGGSGSGGNGPCAL